MIRLWVREVYREQKRKIYFAKMEMKRNGADGQTIGRIYYYYICLDNFGYYIFFIDIMYLSCTYFILEEDFYVYKLMTSYFLLVLLVFDDIYLSTFLLTLRCFSFLGYRKF